LLAGLASALSPFAVLYAPTAFADPLLVFWIVMACVAAAHDHWAAAGVCAALAVLTKQEAPVLLPIAVFLGLPACGVLRAGPTVRPIVQRLALFAAACVAVAGAVELGWEAMRPAQASPFVLGLQHYGGLTLVAPQDIAPRLAQWWTVALQYVFACPLLNLALLTTAVGLPVYLWLRRPRTWTIDLSLVLAALYVAAVRAAATFQLWDRYMLAAARCCAFCWPAGWTWRGRPCSAACAGEPHRSRRSFRLSSSPRC